MRQGKHCTSCGPRYRPSEMAASQERMASSLVRKDRMLIEWPERAEAQLPPATLDIKLTPRGSGRKATVRAVDPALLEALSN